MRGARSAAASAALAVLACAAAAGCGDPGGGRIQRVEQLQRCLASQKKLPTQLTRDARLAGSSQPAELLDTELLSPSAARLYVFRSVDAAESAAAAAPDDPERRDNVVIVYEQAPTADDRAALADCFSGEF